MENRYRYVKKYEIKLKIQFLILFFLYVFSIIAKADTYNIWPTTGNVNDTLFHFEVSTTTAVPDTHYVGMSWNGGSSVKLSGTGKDWFLSTKVPIAGTYEVKFHLHKNDGTKVGDLSWIGSFSVAPQITQQAPTVSIENASASVEQGSTFTVRVRADDQDSNLRDIRIIWGDNDSESFANISGGSATLNGSHIYSFPGTYYWHVVVYDDTAKSTTTSAQTVIVTAPESKHNIVVSSITPTTASIDKPTIFTVAGSGLVDGMEFILPGCEGVNIEYGDQGDSTVRYFLCTYRGGPGSSEVKIRDGESGEQIARGFFVEFRDDLNRDCAATISSDLSVLHIPFIQFRSDNLNLSFSADLHLSHDLQFELDRHSSASVDPFDFIGCEPAILGDTFNVYIPDLRYNGLKLTGFLKYIGNNNNKAIFEAKGAFKGE